MSVSDLFPLVYISVCCGVQGSSTSGESILLLMSSLLALLHDDVTREPPGDAWRPQLCVLRVGGARAVAMAATGQLGGLLGVVLMGVTTVIGVMLFLYLIILLLLLFTSLVVVVSHCSRVVGLIVGLVAAVRQGLDWGGGNI